MASSSANGESIMAAKLAARTQKRKESAEKRLLAADKLKEQGNEHFRGGRWESAAACYEQAIVTYGPKAAYLNNLAACLLKLERWEEAELAASHALKRDPKLVKARYRKALAKKGQGCYREAMKHLRMVIAQDPKAKEAEAALAETKQLLDEEFGGCGDDDDDTDSDLCSPEEVDVVSEATLVLSDSSDYEHDGNGVPCKFYNHNGCGKGTKCPFKHAPDHRSLRDNLGRNVCLFHMLGVCKFSAAKCNYAHDKTYLPPAPNTWDNTQWLANIRHLVKVSGTHRSAKKMELFAATIKPPITPEGLLPRVQMAASEQTMLEYADSFDMYDGLDEREMDERMANCGFTNDEVTELISQGVKPWDDDAWDVLNVINGGY